MGGFTLGATALMQTVDPVNCIVGIVAAGEHCRFGIIAAVAA